MPIKIDLVAELQAALTDPEVRTLLSGYIKQAVKDALAERVHDGARQPVSRPRSCTVAQEVVTIYFSRRNGRAYCGLPGARYP